MLLLWGSKGYQKVLGHTQTTLECGHCNNVGNWETLSDGIYKFTVSTLSDGKYTDITITMVVENGNSYFENDTVKQLN